VPVTVVQQWNAVTSTTTTPASIVVPLLTGAAVAGNLLLLAANADDVIGLPTGYTQITNSIHNAGCYLWAKIAAGGEVSATVVPNAGASICGAIAEIGGVVGGTVAATVDKTATNGTSSGVSSLSSGTTAALAQTDEYSVAVFGYSASQGQLAGGGNSKWDGPPVLTNSYSKIVDVGTTKVVNTNVGLAVAIFNTSALTAQETTGTHTASGGYPSEALIATFKAAAAGAVTQGIWGVSL
jgi:hypothetical protein